MDQGTPHKTRDTKTCRGEIGGKPRRYGHRGKKFLNRTAMACDVRSNRQTGPHKIAKDIVKKTKQQPTD